MGCNTSQELKTKDGSNAANNAANGSEQNEENVVTEQNANNEVEPVHKGGTPNAINEEKLQPPPNKSSGRSLSSTSAISVTTQPPPSSSQPSFNHGNHTNHSKTNSIVSNGDAITIINRQSLTANTLKSTSLPAKENGSLPQAINGISVNYNLNENDDNKFVSDKTEISQLNGIEMGEDEDDDDEMEEEIHMMHHNHSQRASTTTTHHQYQYQHNYHHQHHNSYQHNHHYHHQQYGSKKSHRNPLRNLDLDFKFDVNSF